MLLIVGGNIVMRVQRLLEHGHQLLRVVAVVELAGSSDGFADAGLALADGECCRVARIEFGLFFSEVHGPDERGETQPGVALMLAHDSLDGRRLDGVADVAVD